MNKVQKQTECLKRLQELTTSQDEILAFLLAESVISKEEITAIKRSPDQAKTLQAHLAMISSTNKVQLVEYEWQFLPIERLKVLIVTDRNSKEFSYNF